MDTAQLKTDFATALSSRFPAPVPVPFPPCADVMLSRERNPDANEEIDKLFFEYFKIDSHVIFSDPLTIAIHKQKTGSPPRNLFGDCLNGRSGKTGAAFPPEACLPGSCITLGGKRGTFGETYSRLFAGDLVWLFYFERMGIFKMLGAVLDDFVVKGKYPLPNGDLNALILEAMVRQTKSGLSSTVRDRDSSYRRCLGWTSDVGRKLGSSAKNNAGFNNHFHKFLRLALTWYGDRRLAQAIQTTTTVRKSVATLTAISETLKDLRNTFDEFNYGRNYTHTLSGIVWCVGGLTLIRDLRDALGISSVYSGPSQFIPAVYDLLVKGASAGTTDSGYYSQHVACANNGRDILIDLEFLNVADTVDQDPNRGALTVWLDLVEDKIERYRTAYQGLTGVDLGAPGAPTIEQQA